MKLILTSLSLVSLLAACGGAGESSSTMPTTEPAADTAANPAHDHSTLPAEVAAFHDVIKPLWHDETADRQTKTCAGVPAMTEKFAGIQAMTAPEGKQAEWTAAIDGMQASLTELGTACGGTGDFTASFTKVHDGFHAITALLGEQHDEAAEGHAMPAAAEAPAPEGTPAPMK